MMKCDYITTFSDMFYDVDNNSDIKKIFEDISDFLSCVITRYGRIANVMQNSMEVTEDDGYLHLVITLFVRKLIEQLDAINILYSHGAVTATELVLRSMLETVVFLKFILNEDDRDREETRFRAAAYFMGRHYADLNIADKQLQPGGIMCGKISAEDQRKLEIKRTAVNSLINKNKYFKRVDDARNALRRPEKSSWYEVAGIHTFRDMMIYVGMEHYYEGLYGPLSFETHSLNVAMALNVSNNCLYPEKIRLPRFGGVNFGLTCEFSFISLKVLYKYLDGNEENKSEYEIFYKKYSTIRDKAEHLFSCIRY